MLPLLAQVVVIADHSNVSALVTIDTPKQAAAMPYLIPLPCSPSSTPLPPRGGNRLAPYRAALTLTVGGQAQPTPSCDRAGKRTLSTHRPSSLCIQSVYLLRHTFIVIQLTTIAALFRVGSAAGTDPTGSFLAEAHGLKLVETNHYSDDAQHQQQKITTLTYLAVQQVEEQDATTSTIASHLPGHQRMTPNTASALT